METQLVQTLERNSLRYGPYYCEQCGEIYPRDDVEQVTSLHEKPDVTRCRECERAVEAVIKRVTVRVNREWHSWYERAGKS